MRRATTLLEIIFVVVIIAILSGIAVYSFKPHYLRNDTNFVLMKLKNCKYQAIGYDKSLSTTFKIDTTIGCIDLNNELNDTRDSKGYIFRSKIVNNSGVNILCFDTFGHIHDGEKDDNKTMLKSLIFSDVVITIKYNKDERNITITPQTGYIF